METRSKRELWLIGPECEELRGSRLPSKREVLQVFCSLHKEHTVRDSAAIIADQILDFWSKARIPTKQRCHIISHVEKLFDRYGKLKKNKHRTSETQRQNEAEFVTEIEQLFDVAHENSLSLITIEEDRQFLQLQREGRIGYMAQEDKVLSAKESRIVNRNITAKKRKVKEVTRKMETSSAYIFQNTELEFDRNETLDCDNSPDYTHRMKKYKRSDVSSLSTSKVTITSAVCSTFDRLKIPNRSGSMVVSTVAHSLGVNLKQCTVSAESLRRARIKNREQKAQEIKSSFHTDVPLTVHWDGKLLPDLTGRTEVDRLPILITGLGIEKLLAAPILTKGSGQHMCEATMKALNDWKIPINRVVALCFDTTSSNTGIHAGACTLIEKQIGRTLLHTACRHHVHEVILSHVFKVCFGPSSGPEIKLFNRFRDQWSQLNTDSWMAADLDVEICGKLISTATTFAQKTLAGTQQPREDYKEFLMLTLIFLGNLPAEKTAFRAPGAIHQARWMAKALYAMKIYMFRKQFCLPELELEKVRRFSTFVALIYMEHWFCSPNSMSAPNNDLILMKKLHSYKEIDLEIAQCAEKAMARHLWYLNEHLVCLSFFSSDVMPKTKQSMIKALEKPAKSKASKRFDCKGIHIYTMELEDFVTERSKEFFTVLNLDLNLMRQHAPDKWDELPQYRAAQATVSALKVVNDTAERGVKLVSDFSNSITKDEHQLQYLLQIVESHRHKFPDMRKSTVVKGLTSTDI